MEPNAEVSGAFLAGVLGVTTRRVHQLAAEGVLKRAGRGRYNLADNVRAYNLYTERRSNGHATRPRPGNRREVVAQTLRGFQVWKDNLMPWFPKGAEERRRVGWVVPIDEWAKQNRVGDELVSYLVWGLPTCPPAKGEKLARVSAVHAGIWSLGMRALIEISGGDWRVHNIGYELDRLAGYDRPQDDLEEMEDDEAGGI